MLICTTSNICNNLKQKSFFFCAFPHKPVEWNFLFNNKYTLQTLSIPVQPDSWSVAPHDLWALSWQLTNWRLVLKHPPCLLQDGLWILHYYGLVSNSVTLPFVIHWWLPDRQKKKYEVCFFSEDLRNNEYFTISIFAHQLSHVDRWWCGCDMTYVEIKYI